MITLLNTPREIKPIESTTKFDNSALIDGDVVLYKAGFSIEERYYGVFPAVKSYVGDPVVSVKKQKELEEYKHLLDSGLYEIEKYKVIGDLGIACARVDEMIYQAMTFTGMPHYVVFLSGSTNFRHKIDTGVKYKGNRDKVDRPVYLQELRQYVLDKYRAFVSVDCEADDMLGIYQNDTTAICSIDKDLKMIPGKHYNLTTHEVSYVTPEEGLRSFYRQILTGDAVDNIIGLNRIGVKTAEKVMHEGLTEKEMWKRCLDMYKEKGRSEQDALNNARLLWIQRKHNEVWEPPV